jgi:hypothetical protein
MTKYKCIENACGAEWEIEDGHSNPIPSAGMCKTHARERLTAIYRGKQIAEGNFGCFATATDFCDQIRCCYRQLCLV